MHILAAGTVDDARKIICSIPFLLPHQIIRKYNRLTLLLSHSKLDKYYLEYILIAVTLNSQRKVILSISYIQRFIIFITSYLDAVTLDNKTSFHGKSIFVTLDTQTLDNERKTIHSMALLLPY